MSVSSELSADMRESERRLSNIVGRDLLDQESEAFKTGFRCGVVSAAKILHREYGLTENVTDILYEMCTTGIK